MARQLHRDEAQEVLSESVKEAEKAATKTPGTFPKTPPKQKAPAASNDPDDSSSSSSSNTEDDMSEEAQPLPGPVNPPAVTIRFAPPAPSRFTAEGEDLKPEVFDRWYNTVRLYLNLSEVTGNIPGSGNYWILYTEGKAQEAAHQLLQDHSDDIMREQLVDGLRSIFQTSRQKDELYERFTKLQQTRNGKTRRVGEFITDLKMYRSRLPADTISDYVFVRQFIENLHPKLREILDPYYDPEDTTLADLFKYAERYDAVYHDNGTY